MSDTDYLNRIQQLIELQKVDDEIHEEEHRLESAPAELEKLRQSFQELENRRNIALDKKAHLEDQKKRLSLEIDDDSARIKKSKNKMMQVGNAREYNAMVREMDNMERSNRSREEERLTLLEALEQHNESLETLDAEYNELKKIVDEKSEKLDSTIKAAQEKLEALAHKRKHFSAGISKAVFMRYEFIRNRLPHPVIVGVDNGVCTGCHITVPPQTFIELQTGQQILSCPNCQRLIYWSDEYSPADAAPKKIEKKPSRAIAEDADSELFFENRLKKGRKDYAPEAEDAEIRDRFDEEFADQDDLATFSIPRKISDLEADGDDSEI